MKTIWIIAIVWALLFGARNSFANYESVDVQKSIRVDIKKSYENFSVNRISRSREYSYLLHNDYGDKSYYGRIVAHNGDVLGYFSADMRLVLCVDYHDPAKRSLNGCREIPEGEITVVIPLIPNGEKAEFFNPEGKIILILDISNW